MVPVTECSAVNILRKKKKKGGGFERLPPTSEWALQIPPLKWAYFLTALLPFICMAPRESSLHINTHDEVGKKKNKEMFFHEIQSDT